MGQFTGLFNELENAENKPQPKREATKSGKTRPDKQTMPVSAATKSTTASATAKKNINNKIVAAPLNGSGDTDEPNASLPTRGKRSHPDYTQAPAFVRKKTYIAVKIALLNDERRLNYSDLVEELLTAWLKSKQ